MGRTVPSFEEYWLASKAWQSKGLPLGAAQALANAGFLKVDDLYKVPASDLANIPRVGSKSLAILYRLLGHSRARVPACVALVERPDGS